MSILLQVEAENEEIRDTQACDASRSLLSAIVRWSLPNEVPNSHYSDLRKMIDDITYRSNVPVHFVLVVTGLFGQFA